MADDDRKTRKTVLEALFEIVDKAEEIEDVLILYVTKDGHYVSADNDLGAAHAIFMMEACKHWIIDRIVPSPEETGG